MGKKILTIEGQIEKLRDKGIGFNLLSEEKAKEILEKSTYFYKIYSYRKNFNYNNNTKKYVDLEFKYLYDLSKFDMLLRYCIIQMALDVEHGLKRSLIAQVSCNPNERNNGTLIKDYLIHKIICRDKHRGKGDINDNDINKELESTQNANLFNSNLINHKKVNNMTDYNNWNIWEFVEVIDFGNLINLCKSYMDKYRYEFCNIDILHKVRALRNASAHNNCLIDDTNRKIASKPNIRLVEFCIKKLGLEREIVKKRIATTFVYTFVSLIYCFEHLRTYGAKRHKYDELNNIFKSQNDRIINSLRKSNSCKNLVNSFDFIATVINALYEKYCL